MRLSRPSTWLTASPWRTLRLIGSAVTRCCGTSPSSAKLPVSFPTRSRRFPEVAWQQPVRLRNRIIHGYWSIDLQVLHTTAGKQLPAFTENLRRTLATLQGRRLTERHRRRSVSPRIVMVTTQFP